MSVDFEHRSPRADDVIRVGMIDTEDGDRWQDLGESRAWNWQQGSMLQWVPGSKTEVIWNDRRGRPFRRPYQERRRRARRAPCRRPFYTLSPDGKEAVAPDFRRLNDCRPGYGYAGMPRSELRQARCRTTPASGAWT